MLKIRKIRKQQKWQVFDTESKKVIQEFDSLKKAKEFVKTKKTITKKTEQVIKEQKQPKVRVGRGGGGGRGGYGGIRYQQIDEALLQRKLMEIQQRNQTIQQKDIDNSRKEILKERYGYTNDEIDEILKKGQEAYDRTQGSASAKGKAREEAEHKVQIDILAEEYRDQLSGSVPDEILRESLVLAKERANMTTDAVIANNAFIQKLSNEIRRRQQLPIVNLPPLNEKTAPVYYLPKSVYGGKLIDITKYLQPDAENYRGNFNASRAEGILRKNLPVTPNISLNQQLPAIQDKTVEEINQMFSEMDRRRQSSIQTKPKEPTPQIEDVPMIDPDEQIQAGTNVVDPRSKNDAGNNNIEDQPRMRKTLNKTGQRLMDRLIKSFEKYNIDPEERAGALTIAEQEYEQRGAVGLQDHVAQVIRRFRIENEEALKELENSGVEIPEEQASGTRKKRKADEPVAPVISEPEMQLRQQIQSDNVEPQQFSVQEPPPFVSEDAFVFPQFVGPNVPKEIPFRAPIRRKKKKQTPSVEPDVGQVLSESDQQFLSNQAMAREEQMTRQQQNLQQILEQPDLLLNANLVGLPRSFEGYKTRRLAESGNQQFEYYEPKGPKEERRRKRPSVYDPASETSIVPSEQVNQSFPTQSFGESLQESRSAFD
jgi:ribosomal protein L13E